MVTVCPECTLLYKIAPSKRLNPCPNCKSIADTGESLIERANRKHRESMERRRLKSQAMQADKPKTVYIIPKQSAKGAKQARDVTKVKKELTEAALDGDHIECQGCGNFFDVIDRSHIIPLSQSSALASDPNNITLLCRSCHNTWEFGDAHEMIELKCFVRDMRYMFDNDNARFWNIHYRLLDEYNARPTPKLERVISKLEKFES